VSPEFLRVFFALFWVYLANIPGIPPVRSLAFQAFGRAEKFWEGLQIFRSILQLVGLRVFAERCSRYRLKTYILKT
jgi:hypothetical protein